MSKVIAPTSEAGRIRAIIASISGVIMRLKYGGSSARFAYRTALLKALDGEAVRGSLCLITS